MTKKQARLVGVIHLPPLPGSPRARSHARDVAARAAGDARVLAAAGYDLVMIENFGDAPFFAEHVPHVTVAAMTACAVAVREACPELPLGINVLRNDAEAAMSIAAVVGASCVRVNVLTSARVTDQGVVQGRAAELFRLRRTLEAEGVEVWADIDVKHSAPLAVRALAAEAKDLHLRALADALLVTGEGTGVAVDFDRLGEIRSAVPKAPLLVASGASVELLPKLAKSCDGVIVGSALRADGVAGGAIDRARAEEFASAFRRAFPHA